MEINIDPSSNVMFSITGLDEAGKKDYITSCMDAFRNWEPNITVKFLEILKSVPKTTTKQVVIDCGACFGYYSRIAAELGFDVVAFEPNPAAHSILEKNLECFERSKLLLIKKGLGNIEEKRGLNIPPDNLGGASVIGDESGELEIDITTLDKIGLTHSILIYKIDAEGYEPKIIQGSKNTIASLSPDFIFIEVSPKFVGIEDILENIFKPLWAENYLSFDIGLQDSGEINLALQTFVSYSSDDELRQELNQIPQSNFLFIKKEAQSPSNLTGSFWKDELIMKWTQSSIMELRRNNTSNEKEIISLKDENFKLFQELQKAADYQVELHKHLSFHQDIIAKKNEALSKVKEHADALSASLNQI